MNRQKQRPFNHPRQLKIRQDGMYLHTLYNLLVHRSEARALGQKPRIELEGIMARGEDGKTINRDSCEGKATTKQLCKT